PGASQRDLEGIEPAGNGDCMRHAPTCGQLSLERIDLFAKYQPPTATDAIDGIDRVVTDLLPLARKVVRGHAEERRLGHRGSLPRSRRPRCLMPSRIHL